MSFLCSANFVSASVLTASDTLSTGTMSGASNHTITFTARTTLSSGTIKIYFRNSVSSMGSIDHTDVDLTYGATNASLAATAGTGTWGVSSDTTNKILTLTYPTSGGTPIASSSSVEIKIGTNATSQSTGDAQLVNVASTGNKIESLVAGSDIGLFSVVLVSSSTADSSGSSQSSGSVVIVSPPPPPSTPPPPPSTPPPPPSTPPPPPSTPPPTKTSPPPIEKTLPPELIKKEIVPPIEVTSQKPLVQEVIEHPQLPELPIPPIEVLPHPERKPELPSSSGGSGILEKVSIGLPDPVTREIIPSQGTLVSLKRLDGAGVDIHIPPQMTPGPSHPLTPSQEAALSTCGTPQNTFVERDELLEPEKIEEPIKLSVAPMTSEQARTWSGIQIPSGKATMQGQFYRVTATRYITPTDIPILRFPNPLYYTFQYSDQEVSGINESSLKVYSWDPEVGVLTLECSVVYPETNTVIARIDHLTVFTLVGEQQTSTGTSSLGGQGGSVVLPPLVGQPITFFASAQLDPLQTQLKGDDLGLFQSETTQKQSFAADTFYTTPNTEFSLCIPLSLFKKQVKRITVAIAEKKIPLKLDLKKGCYAASVKMPERKGKQEVVVTIVYTDDQIQILKFQAVVTGQFQANVLSAVAPALEQVKEAVIIVNTQVQKTVETAQPVLQTTAVMTAPVVTVASPTVLTNTMNIWHYLSHILSSLFTILGLRRRQKPWGVVYDAISKGPIDLAIVRLFEAHTKKLIETQVTDKNGRFSFLAPVGDYTITVTKPPFMYPSALAKASIDGEYTHVYHNELFTIKQPDESINLSIPLDPPALEKGVAKEKGTFFQQVKNIFSKYSTLSLVISLVVSFALAVYVPTKQNALLLILNGTFTLIQVYLMQRVEKSWGVVFDMGSAQPLSLAAISIIDALQKKLLRTRLTDYQGRFSFLPPPGEYILTVSKDTYQFPPVHKPKTSKYKNIYTEGKIVLKKKGGVIKANLPMERKEEGLTP